MPADPIPPANPGPFDNRGQTASPLPPADRSRVLRVLDANAHRAVEGLRTLEDYARLVREDSIAAGWLKELRHQIGSILLRWDRPSRLAARSTATDAGTELTNPGEERRASLSEIVPSAVERVQQALRCLEEYSKLLDAGAATEFKRLRYQAYDLLALVERRLTGQRSFAAPQLYLLIDCARELDDFKRYLHKLAEAGIDWFQIRDKSADGRKLVEYTRAAVEATRETGAGVIVNDRVDVAIAGEASGVHVGQDDMDAADVRRLLPSAMVLGVSTHDLQQAREAEQAGADYIGCGPTFSSQTKVFERFAGVEFIDAASRSLEVPLFAIGGIDTANVAQVVAAGCRRIAVSAAIHAADDPLLAARTLKDVLADGAHR